MPGSPRLHRGARRVAALLAGTALLAAGLVPASTAASAATKYPKSLKVPAAARSDDGSKVTSAQWIDSRTIDLTVKSVGLGQSVKVRLLVPKGWTATTKKSFPTLYAYHGGNDHYLSWTRSTDIEKVSAKWNVIVAMPEGGANGSYTNWYNYGKYGTPQWETFHIMEVREILERAYHSNNMRAAMGISSGAQGAVTYAERYPGLFKYVASFSGILSMRSPGIPALLMFTNAKAGVDPFAIWGYPGVDDNNWRQHDPLYLMSRLKDYHTGIYISAGTTGNPGPLDPKGKAPWDIGLISERVVGSTNVTFLQQANQLKIPVTSHIYGDGSHSWPYWNREYKNAWPLIMRAIGAHKV
jgi:S-formylglutathione hydrolase FrmB